MAEDLRVQKTKRALRAALLDLMKEKPIDAITTTELCRRAEVNRNTFYAHYSSPFLLLQTIEDEYISEVLSMVEETTRHEDYETMLRTVCLSIHENRELTALLFSGNGDRSYLDRVVWVTHERVMEIWKNSDTRLPQEDLELLYNYVTFSVRECIVRWTKDGFTIPPEELARKLTNMTEVLMAHYMAKESI